MTEQVHDLHSTPVVVQSQGCRTLKDRGGERGEERGGRREERRERGGKREERRERGRSWFGLSSSVAAKVESLLN